jgi:hypothetical protein
MSFPSFVFLSTKLFFYIQNTNQVLDVFTNNQLDNVKTVASSDETFFAKYLTSEKVCLKKSRRLFSNVFLLI